MQEVSNLCLPESRDWRNKYVNVFVLVTRYRDLVFVDEEGNGRRKARLVRYEVWAATMQGCT